ncbi:GNAT family N-acetyltransferase [Paraliomyxa miuraensis]|uniref:GNAT family N-acetyltransferase n=1 Tax=Paraliomyxa miuraensis TaxID=376150 RepID=UPI00224CC5DE|nr:GNAT family N-acetyltransferase [Paraliomyxa miuraensis]MCX4243555.1 GNAT family N-acetyltransferase [Paraliomyxa miuraensis]
MSELCPCLPDVPVLVTPRLRLRGHQPSDLPACTAMWSDPAVVRYIGGQPFSEEDVWLRFLRYVGHWFVMGYGYWVIEERESGRFVGEAGLGDAHRAVVPDWGRVPEAGWALAPWAHGRGLATEAVEGVLRWADTTLPQSRTVCMIEPDHVASRRVAEKCGYRAYARGQYKGTVLDLFERDRGPTSTPWSMDPESS